jgi:MFS family permease
MQHNFRNLYADVFWFGIVLGSTMAFIGVFAARQGATSFQVSLLSAGPAVINLAFSIPAGRWLEGRPLIRTTFLSSFWHRLGYLVLVFLPWLLSASGQVWAAVLITLLMSIPGTVLAISFNATFAGVVPAEHRATVVGRRNALLALTTTVTSLACGWLLDQIGFPLNYQVVFFLGAAGAFLSTYHLSRLRLDGEETLKPAQLLPELGRSLFSMLRRVRSSRQRSSTSPAPGQMAMLLGLMRSPVAPFMLVFFLFYAFQYTTIPIYPIFSVRELNLTDGQISLGSALFYATMLIASMALGRITNRLGHHGTMVAGAMIFGLYPLLNGLATDATLFWAASLAGGVAWGVTYGGLTNRLMERAPEGNRSGYMALHNLALNLGILSGSLLGPVLAEWIGMRNLLFANAGMRLLAGILLLFWG